MSYELFPANAKYVVFNNWNGDFFINMKKYKISKGKIYNEFVGWCTKSDVTYTERDCQYEIFYDVNYFLGELAGIKI